MQHHRIISITHIDELQQLKRISNSFSINADVTSTRLQSKFYEGKNEVNSGGVKVKFRLYMLIFSSELNSILQTANASLEFRRVYVSNAERPLLLRNFFFPNRRISKTHDKVLFAVHTPIPSSSSKSFLRSYKQARRRDDSSGIVSYGTTDSETVYQTTVGKPKANKACELVLAELPFNVFTPSGQCKYRLHT
ncbi:unnamed protein product [Rotaria sp. Silwood1]|nr:unnamed protein product [Rotaria sp. Silwood1]CAF1473371.1 unnamed protein product [Rotaria sp. Silwood1]CAF4834068.1 unnamed protein product [Rotaria sp. Silwood1]